MTKEDTRSSLEVATAGCSALENPISTLTRLLHDQIQMSDQLEDIADGLPNSVYKSVCADLTVRLPNLMDLSWTINRDIVYPALLRHAPPSGLTKETVERLSNERLTDQGYVEDVCDLLACLAAGGQIHEVNAAGYLLRATFESTRRTAAFELEYVMPAIRRHLTSDDLEPLADILTQHRMIVAPACLSTRATAKSRWP